MVDGDSGIVSRTIGADFIWFDLVFLSSWIFFLIRKKYWLPLIWGICGWAVYMFVDYFLWHVVMGSRHYEGPFDNILFFLWFTLSPGMVQFSYVFLMFEKRNLKDLVVWTLYFYLGWTGVSVGSQLIHFDDREIIVWRDMNESRQRLTFLLMTIGNLVIGVIMVLFRKIRWEDLVYFFVVGTLVEFALELTLSVSGIRQDLGTWSFLLMLRNTLTEFNMGIVLMWLIFIIFRYRRDHGCLKQMSFRDFKHIKTDFNLVCLLLEDKSLENNDSRVKEAGKLYKMDDFSRDILYCQEKYYPHTEISAFLDMVKCYFVESYSKI